VFPSGAPGLTFGYAFRHRALLWFGCTLATVKTWPHVCDETCECQIRLDVAIDLLALSSARLKEVVFSGPNEAVESAYAALRLARMRFLEAQADWREANFTV
jgi:hypothetical protein